MQNKTIQTYIKLNKEIEELQNLKDSMRSLIELEYPEGYTDETINIHFKEVSKWQYSQALKDLKKANKDSIEKAEALEEGSGVATKTLAKVLTITIK